MRYISKDLVIDGLKTKILARKYSTPIYCYSLKKIKDNIKNFKKNFKNVNPLVCFAVKANPNSVLLREMGKLGIGADVVSIGELMMALKSGIKPNKIVFSGVGKTDIELKYAIKKKILLINAESRSEVLTIEKIAKKEKKIVNIGLRLNPNIDPKTLSQISTGKKENKFGISEKEFLHLFAYIKKSKNLKLKCLSVHIGSQILSNKPYEETLNVLDGIFKKMKYSFDYIDLGGGMGIDYDNTNRKLDLKKYSKIVQKFKKKITQKLFLNLEDQLLEILQF